METLVRQRILTARSPQGELVAKHARSPVGQKESGVGDSGSAGIGAGRRWAGKASEGRNRAARGRSGFPRERCERSQRAVVEPVGCAREGPQRPQGVVGGQVECGRQGPPEPKTWIRKLKEKIIDRIVSPMFDFPLMGQLALGRTHWPKLDAAQREKFIRLFVTRLKALYLEKTALYTNEKVVLKPAVPKKNTIQIPMTLISEDEEIALLYKLHKMDEAGQEQGRRTLENLRCGDRGRQHPPDLPVAIRRYSSSRQRSGSSFAAGETTQ